jgi:predicted amidohydrolase YtcJ
LNRIYPSRRRAGLVAALACALTALVVESGTAVAAAPPAPPELILYNGKISTIDARNTRVAALAIRDGVIVARGTNAAMLAKARRGTELMNLRGRYVLPGLIDGTLHGIRMGSYFCFSRSPRFDALFTRQEAIDNVRLKASLTPPGRWLFAIGGGWHVNQFNGTAEDGMLTKAELDAAAPNHPVLLAGGGFSGGQMNTRGLEAMGYTASTPGVNMTTGQVTNVAGTNALTAAQRRIGAELKTLTLQEQIDCTRDFVREMNRRGLTSWDDPGGNNPYSSIVGSEPVISGNNGYQAINELHRRGELNARVRFNLSCFGPDVPAPGNPTTIGLACVRDYVTAAVGTIGDDILRIGGIGEEVMNTVGGIYPDPEYGQILDLLAAWRWPLQHHATAPPTQQAMVASWERANARNPITDLRWVMLHPAGGPENPSADTLARLKALNAGIVLTNSSIHASDTDHPPYRRTYESGIRTCSGTDALNVAPYPPFINAYYMFSGRGKLGQPAVAPDQTLTRLQALEMLTSKCDWFMDLDGKVGVLAPGRYADLIVLDKDYFTIPAEEVMTLTSVLTLLGGRTVYRDEAANLRAARACVVPNVRRTTLAGARATLRERGCRTGAVARRHSSRVAAGQVIRQSRRPGTVAALNAAVTLVVSRGARARVAGAATGGAGLTGRDR